jgi:hypothetical protein
MSAHSRFASLREVIRAASNVADGGPPPAASLDAVCAEARRKGVPERLLRPSLVLAARAWSDETLPLGLGRQLAAGNGAALAAFNAELLGLLAERVGLTGESTEDALLLGDAALLSGLYGNLGAFPLRLPIAATLGASNHGETLPLYLRAHGGVLGLMPFGPLAELARAHSRPWSDGARTWRVPRRELMLTMLLARLGDPLAHPDPPLWHHLGLLLLVWKTGDGRDLVLEHAARLGLLAQVARGLAVLGHLFPELHGWAGAGRVVQLSLLERSLAVPLAARQLVGAAFGEDPADTARLPARMARPARSG